MILWVGIADSAVSEELQLEKARLKLHQVVYSMNIMFFLILDILCWEVLDFQASPDPKLCKSAGWI